MFDIFKAILLGAVQGITEFLPISSTGHLILVEKLLNVSQETYGLTFDAALHLGTLVAILWYFRDEWIHLAQAFTSVILNLFQDLKTFRMPNWPTDGRHDKDSYNRLSILLIIGTIPAMILGLLLEKKIETAFRSPVLIALALIIFSFVLWYVEKVGHKNRKIKDLSVIDSLIIGTAQSIALIPGVSRSGITIASGMWRNVNRTGATRFAFLLSAPIIAGAGGLQLLKLFKTGISFVELQFFVAGMISATIFGYLTIKYFIAYITKHGLGIFIIYRLLLGFSILMIAILSR